SLDKAIEWTPIEDSTKIPLFITLRHLDLSFSTLLHSPKMAAPVLEHLFPRLESLTLNRNKVNNPTNGANCGRCAKMRCITAFSCKHNLVKALRDSSLSHMRSIRIQVESQFDEQSPVALQSYEVYCYKRNLWTIENVPF